MKLLTKEEEDEHYKAVLRGGISGGAIGTSIGLGASLLLQRRWPFFRTLTLPLKAFFVSSSTTFGAIINADRYSRGYEASRHAELNQFQDSTSRQIAEALANRSTWEKTKDWGREYRYPIVTTSWAASMAASLAIVSRDKYLTTAQKLVQARMYAQGLTLLVLVATAAFEVSDAKNKNEDILRIADPNHPGRMVEKRVHHENYAGEDLWKDMVEAEEKRLEIRRKMTSK
ncbi:hypothetical protein EDC01DRAFT_488815 [Geopyxis carbonaria]|nr:hypothetical protein EDC01DRAFT_488815 [Geopyxis carbonaria]